MKTNSSFGCPHCPPRFGYFAYCKECQRYNSSLDEDLPEAPDQEETLEEDQEN